MQLIDVVAVAPPTAHRPDTKPPSGTGLLVAAVFAPTAAALVLLVGSARALPTWSAGAAGVVLLLAGVAARRGRGPRPRRCRAVGTLVAGCGIVLVATAAAPPPDLLAAATSPTPSVVLLLIAGLSPSVLRILPVLALRVPPECGDAPQPLHVPTIERLTVRAGRLVTAGTVAVVVLVTAGFGVAVRSDPPDAVTRWALLAEGVLLAGALGLASRPARTRCDQYVLLAGAELVFLATVYLTVHRTGSVLVAVVVPTVSALGALGVTCASDTRRRSPRTARAAEALGGLCVAGSFPAALLAAGVVGVLRQAAT